MNSKDPYSVAICDLDKHIFTKGTKMYQPRDLDLQWTKSLLSSLKNGGHWAAPAMGIFVIDHDEKKVTMVLKTPTCDEELLQITDCCLQKCGYELVKKEA
jgi:hypothetical protein